MEAEIVVVRLEGVQVILVSILVLWLGIFLNRKVSVLNNYNIPVPVSGGLICSLAVTGLYVFAQVEVDFDLTTRDTLLIVFFSTVGLSAKFHRLVEGGRSLAILLVIAVFFLVFQNLIGTFVATSIGIHPAAGLIGGSISFAGGHGTAITWGQIFAERYGMVRAVDIGIACATFGLILGGLVGGPIAKRLISVHGLTAEPRAEAETPGAAHEEKAGPVTVHGIIDATFMIGLCVAVGATTHLWITELGFTLPGFLTAMFTGIVITNLVDLLKIKVAANATSLISDISLELFLAMSLMSMKLWTLASAAGPILVVLVLQVVLIVLFAYFVVFRLMGRDYDACCITVGFAGLGLGATPVGIANMNALTSKYGASPKAYLVVPLLGAFFIDIANAFVIQGLLSLPFYH